MTELVATITQQRADEKTPFRVRLSGGVINYWQGGKVYRVNERVRPLNPNGYEYQCTTAGQTKKLGPGKEPVWPTTVDATLNDGSVTWTCKGISAASLTRYPTGVTYDVPTGVTITGNAIDVADGKCEFSAVINGVPTISPGDVIAHVAFNDGSHADLVITVEAAE